MSRILSSNITTRGREKVFFQTSRHELTTAMQHLCITLEGVPLSRDLQIHVKPW